MESSGNAIGGFLPIVFLLGLVALGIVALAFWIWMLVDCATRTPPENNTKLVWVLIVVLTGWIGALIYFFVQRPKNPARSP